MRDFVLQGFYPGDFVRISRYTESETRNDRNSNAVEVAVATVIFSLVYEAVNDPTVLFCACEIKKGEDESLMHRVSFVFID